MAAITTWQASCQLPTEHGEFDLHVFTAGQDGPEEVLALARLAKAPNGSGDREPPLIRIHSACLTGDLLGSLRCDCGPQLTASLRLISRSGNGVLLYLPRHEGRGIGLTAKIRAYALQEKGLNTVEANEALDMPVDSRDYSAAVTALNWLDLRAVRLATNNPAKIEALRAAGLAVTRVPLSGFVTDHNAEYLRVKDELMGHLASRQPMSPTPS